MSRDRIYHILVKLTDKALPWSTRKQIALWLLSEQDEAEKEEALLRIWMELPHTPDERVKQSFRATQKKINGQKRRSLFMNWMRYAAVFLLCVLTGVSVWWVNEKRVVEINMIECYVPHAEMETIRLPDGTMVQVNSGSLLLYPEKFAGDERVVYLSGEARFSVTNSMEKSFVVRTGVVSTEVLGTEFNIEAYPGSGHITTTLENGAVKVYKRDNREDAILLHPNEQAMYSVREDRFVLTNVEAADYSFWISGGLRFQNRSFAEILSTLERKYDVFFDVDPGISQDDNYTMKFKAHETLEDVLNVFCQIVGNITYQKEGQKISLSSKRKEVAR